MSEKVVNRQVVEMLENLLNNMKYGSITLIVQDGKIIQIDKTEKHRLKD